MKNKIIILTAILAMIIAMLSTAIIAATTPQINTADAMNELGLFKGISDTGYALDAPLTRIQGVVMVIRMLGKEEEALSGKYVNKIFKDIPMWANDMANKYVAYAYDTGITWGRSDTDGVFDAEGIMNDYMFITFVLRAIGYTEKVSGYVWDKPFAVAKDLGIIDYTETDAEFTRAEAVNVFWNAFDVKLCGQEITLAEKLISEGIFTEAEYASAKATHLNGRTENVGVPLNTTEPENTEVLETEAPETTKACETTGTPETTVHETEASETTGTPDTTNEPEYTRDPDALPED